MNVEARYYAKDNEHITCHLCPHTCAILPGKKGICRSRMNENGTLYAINYGETTSMAIDPVEKKPLYHYFPGRSIVSIAPNNCNMRCPFCQNWEISQEQVKTHFISPETLVNMMQNHDSFGIAYTYTEPLMWYEYLLDAGKAIHQAGGKNVLVTNGVINREPLEELLPFIDAMNIDLKTMDEQAYAKILGGDLNAVKQTIEIARSQCHVEITNLLVTGFNDKKKDMDALIDYIASLSKDIPVHFSRYYPNYRYEQPPTSEKRLQYAYRSAKEKGLSYVYIGNVPSEDGSNTYCPQCNNLLIERMHYQALLTGLKGNACKKCGTKINIVTE
jgi:pyruvate formate lyase activating enzyme